MKVKWNGTGIHKSFRYAVQVPNESSIPRLKAGTDRQHYTTLTEKSPPSSKCAATHTIRASPFILQERNKFRLINFKEKLQFTKIMRTI